MVYRHSTLYTMSKAMEKGASSKALEKGASSKSLIEHKPGSISASLYSSDFLIPFIGCCCFSLNFYFGKESKCCRCKEPPVDLKDSGEGFHGPTCCSCANTKCCKCDCFDCCKCAQFECCHIDTSCCKIQVSI